MQADNCIMTKSSKTVIKEDSPDYLKNQIEQLYAQLETQKREIMQLRDTRDELFLQLQRFHGVHAQLRSLLIEVYLRINSRIDNIGKFRPNMNAPEFQKSELHNDSLMTYIIQYDKNAFSQQRTIGGSFRRSISKCLKFMLKGMVVVSKVFVKSIKRIMRRNSN